MAACAGQDSLNVRGWMSLQRDTLLLNRPLQMETSLSNMSWDSTWQRVPRHAPVVAWAKGPRGQAQLEAEWPRFGDSLTVALSTDTLGLVWSAHADTIVALWTSFTEGCFPVTPEVNSTKFVNLLKEIPFESKRQEIALQWVGNHCLSASSLAHILVVFDDENRRLTLIKNTLFDDIQPVGSLVEHFATTHYREAFSLWWQGVR